MPIKFQKDLCFMCGRCVETCPMGVFEMTDEGAKVKDIESCISCGSCIDMCAGNALSLE